MIRTLEQFNEAYRKLKESPRGEWFTHNWRQGRLETEFARFSERGVRFLNEEEEEQERELAEAMNEKDLLSALLVDLGVMSRNYREEFTNEQQ
jgi:hypothetical protein